MEGNPLAEMGLTASKRRMAWRKDSPRPVRRPDVRDQLGLRIGWVRFWLRAILLGLGLWVISASLGMWVGLVPQMAPLAVAFLWAGLILMPAGALLALASWILPLPHERKTSCPACGHQESVLSLPWILPYTCRNCRRKGQLSKGRMRIDGVGGGNGR